MANNDIDDAYRAGVKRLIEAHGGNATSAMRDPEWHLVSERSRAQYVMLANPGVDAERLLAAYAVDKRVVADGPLDRGERRRRGKCREDVLFQDVGRHAKNVHVSQGGQ